MRRKPINHAWVLRRYDGFFAENPGWVTRLLGRAKIFGTRDDARRYARAHFTRGDYRIRRVELA
jgi:hypothetical protein